MSNVYLYVVDRDFGFAPNPFHGLCTLATCKPKTRRVAKESDWIIGMGGKRLNATSRCIFAMKVSKSITFDEYWSNPLYEDKKPVRHGSMKMMVGDNIYHKVDNVWQQLNSHHSYSDGSSNMDNLTADTKTNSVLISDHFYYFGAAAIEIPSVILLNMPYKNGRDHRKYSLADGQPLISFIENNSSLNIVTADPFDFKSAKSRYSIKNNKVSIDS